MRTLTLNDKWDIQLDSAGHIVYSDGDYATAQTAANAIRLFTKDAYFDQTRGIPHFDIELGHKSKSAESVLINRIRQACMNVEGVTDCRPVLEYGEETRKYSGNVYITVGENVVAVEV